MSIKTCVCVCVCRSNRPATDEYVTGISNGIRYYTECGAGIDLFWNKRSTVIFFFGRKKCIYMDRCIIACRSRILCTISLRRWPFSRVQVWKSLSDVSVHSVWKLLIRFLRYVHESRSLNLPGSVASLRIHVIRGISNEERHVLITDRVCEEANEYHQNDSIWK